MRKIRGQEFSNPVLSKELRGRMRSSKTAWILTAYLFVLGAFILGLVILDTADRTFYRPGESEGVFLLLAILQLLLIGFLAPGLTAGTISGERERQTLNILLTTHLSAAKIVLGKMMAALAFISLLVFATLPLYAVAFLFGGVGPGQVALVFVFYLMAMILFGSIGIFCSARFKRTAVSVVVSYGLTFFVLGGTALMVLFYHEFMADQAQLRGWEWARLSPEAEYFLQALNPVMNLIMMIDPDSLLPAQGADGKTFAAPIAPWLYWGLAYMPLSVLLLLLSIRAMKRKE